MTNLTKEQHDEAINAVADALEALSERFEPAVVMAVTAAIVAASAGQLLADRGVTLEQLEESAEGMSRSFRETCINGYKGALRENAETENEL